MKLFYGFSKKHEDFLIKDYSKVGGFDGEPLLTKESVDRKFSFEACLSVGHMSAIMRVATRADLSVLPRTLAL